MSNHLSHVAAAAERWPDEWRTAHTNSSRTEDFIRLLASFLHHEIDPNVGLNGKRGNPNDISDDALAVFDPNGDVVDRTGRRMIIIDCIIGAGGPDPRPGWSSVGGPSPGAWVQPARIHDAQPVPPDGGGVPPPPPDVSAGLTERLKAIETQLTALASQSAEQTQAQKQMATLLSQLVESLKSMANR
jgi:hypothetical protein